MQEEPIDAVVSPPVDEPKPHYLHFKFTGNAGEYFRIWIVNVLLSILTLGIYSAWAKVRNKKYFYRHTWLDDTSFDYHADPKRILIGRVIIGAGFAAIFLAEYYSLPVYFALLGALWLVSPWIVIKALSFNARNSSYRNVRFSFAGELGEAFLVQVGLFILCIATLGLLTPYADWRFRVFVCKNHRYGTRPFAFSCFATSFYVMYLKFLLLSFAAGVGVFLVAVMVIAVTGGGADGGAADQAAFLFVVAFYLAILLPTAYIRATTANLIYNHTAVDGHRFRSRQGAWPLFGIYVSNLLAVLCSLGFLVPWAKVRLARYRARCTSLLAAGSLTVLADQEQEQQAALGEAAADFGDFDFGL